MAAPAQAAEQMDAEAALLQAGIDAHPHARAILTPALARDGNPSHAYLFHGPAGTGKRAVARAFAAALDPKLMIPIHGIDWDAGHEGFPPIRRLVDGEAYHLG